MVAGKWVTVVVQDEPDKVQKPEYKVEVRRAQGMQAWSRMDLGPLSWCHLVWSVGVVV